MDAIEDIIKIYVTGKWLESIEHKFSFSEIIKSNKTCLASHINVYKFNIVCESVAETLELANCENLKKLFDELKRMSIISEQQVIETYLGIDQRKSNTESKLQLISQQIFNINPVIQCLNTGNNETSFQVILGDIILEILGTESQITEIVYFFMINRIKRIFGNECLIAVSESSVINIKILSKEIEINEKENINEEENHLYNNGNTVKSLTFPLHQSSINNENANLTDSNARNDCNNDEKNQCIKFLKSVGFMDSTALYLDEIINNAIYNQVKTDKKKRLKSIKRNHLKKELKSSVDMILSEMLVANEINASEYEFLPDVILKKIQSFDSCMELVTPLARFFTGNFKKILNKKERKVDVQRIREFIPIYLKSIRKKKKDY